MVIILGDLIADISMRLQGFPVKAGDIQRLSYLELGPGGATNVAIMAARFNLPVACLGEVGDDHIGRLLLDSLRLEGINVSNVVITPGAETPVAGVLVDPVGEPAYLGHPGTLRVNSFPKSWREPIQAAEALFSDGWVEHEEVSQILLEGFQIAKTSEVPLFFDPGPGNPDVDNAWWDEMVSLSSVVLANENEINQLTGEDDSVSAAESLCKQGVELVVLKRGVAGCVLVSEAGMHITTGFPVQSRDTTGAGDSLAAAIIFGYLRKLSLEDLGALANLTGAAKVRKYGTGLNMPTLEEIQAVMDRFDVDPDRFFP